MHQQQDEHDAATAGAPRPAAAARDVGGRLVRAMVADDDPGRRRRRPRGVRRAPP